MKRMIHGLSDAPNNLSCFQSDVSSLIQYPGDRVEAYMTKSGNKILKIDCKGLRVTGRDYTRLGGKPGKKTLLFMQPR